MNPSTSQLLNFLLEIFLRFRSKAPKFFRILQTIFAFSFLITGLPGFIEWIGVQINHPVTLPEWATLAMNKAIGWVTFAGYLFSRLPSETPVVAVAPTQTLLSTGVTVPAGTALKATDPTELPFTATAEKKDAAEATK